MSEFWSLTGSEKRRLVEVVVDATRGKCPVIAHTGHRSARAGHRAHQARAEGGRGLRGADQPVLPGRLRRGPVPLVQQVCGAWTSGSGCSTRPTPGCRCRWTSSSGWPPSRTCAASRSAGITRTTCGCWPGSAARSWSASRTRAPGWRTCATTASACFMSSAAPYLYQTPDWQPMREYTGLALAGDFTGAAPGRGHARPGARGGRQVAARQAADGRLAGLDQGVGRAWSACPAGRSGCRCCRTPRPRWPSWRPTWTRSGCSRAAARSARALRTRPPAGAPLSPSPRPGRGRGRDSITMAALRPGAPVIDPPGWVVPPVWYRPGMGIRCAAQPGAGPERAAERRARGSRRGTRRGSCAGSAARCPPGDLTRLARITSSGKPRHPAQPVQLVPGVLVLELRPSRLGRAGRPAG